MQTPTKAETVLQGPFWVRLCEGVNTRGFLKPLEVIQNRETLNRVLGADPSADWYSSLYYYTQDAKKHFDEHKGSVKGYQGPAYSTKLLFDFDSQADIDKAKSDSLSLLERLQNEGVSIANSCRVFFSGSKGFHVEVITERQFTPEELKPLCTNLAADLETFDPSVYNATRLVRVVNTKHQKSNLYKIELEPDDLINLSVDEIKERAKKPGPIFQPNQFKPIVNTDFLKKYEGSFSPIAKPVIVDVDDIEGIRGLGGIDFSKMPRNVPRCIYVLSHGVMKPGERNHIFMRLAAYYRNQGLTKDVCYNVLKGIARENFRLYPENNMVSKGELWNTVVNSVYSDGWKQIPGAAGTDEENLLLKKYCNACESYTNKRCLLHTSSKEDQIVRIDAVFDSFKYFAENLDKNTVKTGINFIDSHMNIARGTTTLLVGAPGSGKTTAALNIMENTNAMGQYTMFFSLDMHKNLIYLKLAQKLTNYSQNELLRIFKFGDKKKMDEIKLKISQKYGKTFFDFNTSLTLEGMRDKIFEVQEQTGADISLVVVDYASRIKGPYTSSYDNARHNALTSTEIANVTDSAWIIISQISRQTGDGCTPIRTKRAAKDAGDWEESATNVITCWRPFMGESTQDDVMRVFLAKNRMGSELEEVLHWDGAKGLIRDMSSEDRALYEEMRGDAAEKAFLKSRYTAKIGGG